ncbi:hypothetical protein GQ44DRAFT_719457 [Phaeosphaeriaceae sp. PMI808]|nr:hypothetical protein GQ44DRAFT_719457 [Phaeosphaeriaceae sp. PMI808]
MAKPKRMSDIFASSVEQDPSAIPPITTGPYSSEGPTLPIIGAAEEPERRNNKVMNSNVVSNKKVEKYKKAESEGPLGHSIQRTQPSATIHPALFEPWNFLGTVLFKLLQSQNRIRVAQNIVPVVFTKNQNINAGIKRLKTYLGAYRGDITSTKVQDSLEQRDVIIVISAHGVGTTKLVSIIDVLKRAVSPITKEAKDSNMVDTWYMYTLLTSIEEERKIQTASEVNAEIELDQNTQGTEEEDAFEPMGTILSEKDKGQDQVKPRKVPVLSIWMTRIQIPRFKDVFGEQTLMVQRLPQDE